MGLRIALSGVAVAAFALFSGAASAAPAVGHVGKFGSLQSEMALPAIIYNQVTNRSDIGIGSQNFEAGNDMFDDVAADDFVVPAGKTWGVQYVEVGGIYFNGAGPSPSQNVVFYRNAGGLPGAAIASFNNLVGRTDGTGSFSIKLPSAVRLTAGTYWVSVQANLDFTVGGQWAWQNRTTTTGNGAAWKNPLDGFGSGCTTFQAEATCIPDSPGDHVFRLRGRTN